VQQGAAQALRHWAHAQAVKVVPPLPQPLWAQTLPLRRLVQVHPGRINMIERVIEVEVPFAWVAGDSVYGVGEIRRKPRQAVKGHVLGVNATHTFNAWTGKPEVTGTAEAIAARLPPASRQCLLAGEGTKGPRFHDRAYLELADLETRVPGGRNRDLDPRPVHPASPRQRLLCPLYHLAPGPNHHREAGRD
jgi:hypothetical protein